MSFLSYSELSAAQIQKIFQTALFFKTKEIKPKMDSAVIAHLFFEPSTRTRMSFEIASHRLGARTVLLSGKSGTSLEKDESIEDTILNVAAMRPDALVIRSGDDLDMKKMSAEINIPIINAGWGKKGHPTQALLDILTLIDLGRNIDTEKILFVGDIKHSRVVTSHIQLAQILGYEIGFCGPTEFMPKVEAGQDISLEKKVHYFDSLSDGLAWADTVMALRVQLERHQESLLNLETYIQKFQINLNQLARWKKDGILMHPGPVNFGTELSLDIRKDTRCKILDQVYYGVLVRMSIIYHLLKEPL